MKSLALVIIFLSYFLYVYAQEKDSTRAEKEIKRAEIIVPWFVERFKISAGGIYVVNRTNIQVGINGHGCNNDRWRKRFGI